jgi:hypothetical protein
MSTEEENNQDSFEQTPPIVDKFYVQKLATPLPNGANVIFTVKYLEEDLAQDINVYLGDQISFTLKDDGVYPDLVSKDYKYTVAVEINISEFLARIDEMQSQIEQDGGVTKFIGHDAHFVSAQQFQPFNSTGFQQNAVVPIPDGLLDVTQCSGLILKQNSLFITELKVVEDNARTFNVLTRDGNPNGAWTFNILIKNICNESATGITPKEFIKNWIENWTKNQMIGSFAINNNLINSEDRLLNTGLQMDDFVGKWVRRARQTIDQNYNTVFDNTTNWKAEIDNLYILNNAWNLQQPPNQTRDFFMEYAPFKLMAIVNRLDLMANTGYAGTVNNAGETRFIFTLIDPFTGDPPVPFCIGSSAQVGGNFGCSQSNSGGGTSTNDAIDWVGMNVILEYGNPITNKCDLKNFAQLWYDLSSYNLETEEYCEKLEEITHLVTDAGLAPGKNFHSSAINQIRTNEKMLSQVNCNYIGSSPGDWRTAAWELRQFELGQNTPYLKQVVLTNTPYDKSSSSISYKTFNSSKHLFDDVNSPVFSTQSTATDPILSWIYQFPARVNRVIANNHNLPEQFLDGTATMYGEMTHHFGFDWQYFQSYYPNQPFTGNNETTYMNSDNPNLTAKQIRHHISLNTCQGCHGGDTKTNFTHMIPRGYQELANYWDAIPTVVTWQDAHTNSVAASNSITGTGIDPRFMPTDPCTLTPRHVNNPGKTVNKIGTVVTKDPNMNYAYKTGNQTNQIVSAFITGRLYSSVTPGNWEDDELDNTLSQENNGTPANNYTDNTIGDNSLKGFYYVDDPSNDADGTNLPDGKGGSFPQIHDKKWGFNELELRKKFLCDFLSLPCSSNGNSPVILPTGIDRTPVIGLIDEMKKLKHLPFAKGAH